MTRFAFSSLSCQFDWLKLLSCSQLGAAAGRLKLFQRRFCQNRTMFFHIRRVSERCSWRLFSVDSVVSLHSRLTLAGVGVSGDLLGERRGADVTQRQMWLARYVIDTLPNHLPGLSSSFQTRGFIHLGCRVTGVIWISAKWWHHRHSIASLHSGYEPIKAPVSF